VFTSQEPVRQGFDIGNTINNTQHATVATSRRSGAAVLLQTVGITASTTGSNIYH
jgi:hypothetical protein